MGSDSAPTPGLLDARVVLAGPGRAGRAFARSWKSAGGSIAQVLVRTPSDGGALPPELADSEAVRFGKRELPPCDVLVLAVPDDAIAPAAVELAQGVACRFVLHLSGALPARILEPFAARGAAVASLHPVRPFTGASDEDWRGAFVAIEGDPAAVEAASEMARLVGARPHVLSPEAKPLYHAAASIAAGGAAAVVSVAVRAWIAAGIPEEIAREVLAGLAERAVAAAGRQPFTEAFTGAVARRDAGTVRAHTRALSPHADALALYRALAEEILLRTPDRGREEEIRRILAGA
jgi:predicted short-subunit dehydrogenase-like oxidoreductase (DUF2520 family)